MLNAMVTMGGENIYKLLFMAFFDRMRKAHEVKRHATVVFGYGCLIRGPERTDRC